MNPELQSPARSFPATTVLIVVLSLATVSFAGLFVWYFMQSSSAKSTLTDAKHQAATEAAQAQKKADAAAAEVAAESPFRSYQAPTQFGSFTVKFPKNWSSRVAESESNQTQVNLSVNPDFVRYKDDQAQAVALRVRLIQQSSNAFLGTYEEAVKKGTLKKSNTAVSGQNAVILLGHFKDDSGAAGFSKLVAVPVRDKVIVFTTENDLYLSQFDTVVSQAKIIP